MGDVELILQRLEARLMAVEILLRELQVSLIEISTRQRNVLIRTGTPFPFCPERTQVAGTQARAIEFAQIFQG
jgi:hypothetical protein